VSPKTQSQQDVTQSWAEAQRRLWEGWLEAMRQAGAGLSPATAATPTRVLARAIDTWEPFVRQTLEAQSAAMQAWVDGLAGAPNVPEQVRLQLQQVQELTRGWTETQRQLWDAMFAAVRQVAASATEQRTPAAQLPAIELWQQIAGPVLEAQATWLRQLSGMLAGARAGQSHHEQESRS
jgi:hypothetical protein